MGKKGDALEHLNKSDEAIIAYDRAIDINMYNSASDQKKAAYIEKYGYVGTIINNNINNSYNKNDSDNTNNLNGINMNHSDINFVRGK